MTEARPRAHAGGRRRAARVAPPTRSVTDDGGHRRPDGDGDRAGIGHGSGGRSDGVRLVGVTKAYGRVPVIADLDLELPNLGFTVLVGPSGCGKTTCLRVIAGLERVQRGRVLIGDDDVTATPARERGVAMVFQDYALYPHMTVEQNVSFGLRLEARHHRRRGPSRAAIARRVAEAVTLLGLDGLADRRPSQLSGGQQQRVALARAIVRQPRLFLMDEPLSNLDAQLRAQTRQELLRLHRRLGTTVVYVTHDQAEALTMATHLVVLRAGRVEQAGPPDAVYGAPANTFVATFIGSPPMNLVPTGLGAADGARRPVRSDGMAGAVRQAGALPSRVTLGFRPARATLHADEAAGGAAGPATARHASAPLDARARDTDDRAEGIRLRGVVELVELLGDDDLVTVMGSWGRVGVLHRRGGTGLQPGAAVAVTVPAEHLLAFDSNTGARLSPETGAHPSPDAD